MNINMKKGQVDEFGLTNPEEYNKSEMEYVAQQCVKRVAQYEEDRNAIKSALNELDELSKNLIKHHKNLIEELISIINDDINLSVFFKCPGFEDSMKEFGRSLAPFIRDHRLIFRYYGSDSVINLFTKEFKFSYTNDKNSVEDYLLRIKAAKAFVENVDFNEIINNILKYCQSEQEEFIKKFSKLFDESDISKIHGRDVSCGSHWAWGDRFFIFTFNGKCYHYEDYNSGAYTNVPCSQLRCFRLVDLADAKENNYDAKTLLDIEPQSVGLTMSRRCVTGGKIDLVKLDQIATNYLNKNEKEKNI